MGKNKKQASIVYKLETEVNRYLDIILNWNNGPYAGIYLLVDETKTLKPSNREGWPQDSIEALDEFYQTLFEFHLHFETEDYELPESWVPVCLDFYQQLHTSIKKMRDSLNLGNPKYDPFKNLDTYRMQISAMNAQSKKLNAMFQKQREDRE